VRLNSLHLTNFRQHAETRIEFDLGLTGIIGPNGAGKSTVLEAIAWALYGVRRAAERVIRSGTSRRPPRAGQGRTRLRPLRAPVSRRSRLEQRRVVLDGGGEPIATTITDVSDLLARRLE
jgi:exonuclease SbcC